MKTLKYDFFHHKYSNESKTCVFLIRFCFPPVDRKATCPYGADIGKNMVI